MRRIAESARCANASWPVTSHESALPAMSLEGRLPAAYRIRRIFRPQNGSLAASNIDGPVVIWPQALREKAKAAAAESI